MIEGVFYALILVLVAVMIITLPPNWKAKRWQRILIGIYAACTVLCFSFVISISKYTDDGPIRTFFIYANLILFVLSSSFSIVFILRYLLTYIAIRIKAWKAVGFLLRDRTYSVGVLLFSVSLLLIGTVHFNICKTVSYTVNLTDGEISNPNQCRICLISDVHLGAGADRAAVDRMCESLSQQHPGLICITGDLVDMTSSENDVLYFVEKLRSVETNYGIYYVEGNHEKDSAIDCQTILEENGITCLYDEAAVLENGLVIVGRKDSREVSVAEILRASSIDEAAPAVVLSHQPKGYSEMGNGHYLVLSGHTHGYQIPVYGLVNPFSCELPYGCHEFGTIKAITTSGVSAWGFRIKWPSYNEICSISLIF